MTSFNEAFKKARKEKGAGATFTWNGKKYTTDYKDEAKAASAPKTNSTKPKAAPMRSSKVPNSRTKNAEMEIVRRNARAITDTTSPARSVKGKVVDTIAFRKEASKKGFRAARKN